MKLVQTLVVCSAMALVPAASAQKWEFGGGVGGGFYPSQDITTGSASAAAKIATNLVGSGWYGSNSHGRWGGEIRYEYQRGDLQLNSGGISAAFGAHSHAMHYDVLWHATPNGSIVRPFVSVGAGIKIFEGTGTEVVYQPLSNVAVLTKAQDLVPLVSVGAGLKFRIASRLQLRIDVHDYMTTFPKKTIALLPNSKVTNWMQDIVPMVGIVYTSSEGR